MTKQSDEQIRQEAEREILTQIKNLKSTLKRSSKNEIVRKYIGLSIEFAQLQNLAQVLYEENKALKEPSEEGKTNE